MKHAEARLKNISNLLQTADKNLRKAHKLLDTLREEVTNSFDDVPGVLGIFNGTHMVDEKGKEYEVNPNYAAKSLLVSGDNLKMVEGDEGRLLFKQVSKVDRKQLAGILNKKEGKWYALTDAGSYRISDVSIEFRDGQVNDEITVLVPEGNLNSKWAVLETMAKEAGREEKKEFVKEKEEKEEKPKKKTPAKKPAAKKTPVKKEVKESPAKKKVPVKKPAEKKAPAKKKPSIIKKLTTKKPVDEVNSLLDDDDDLR